MDMSDVELKLLLGLPIEIAGVGKLYPLTLREISTIGETEYNKLISISTFKQEDLEIDGRKLTPFESVLVYTIHDENFRKLFVESLSKFFKEQVHFHFESGLFYLGSLQDSRLITEEKYNEIVEVVKRQNFIKDSQKEEEEFNPFDEKAAEFAAQIKKFRQKVKERNQEGGLNLRDIISIVASYSQSYNLFNIFDLTIFQLYETYIRLMMRDNYESQFAVYLQGAEIKDMKHWARKIDI